MKKLGRHANTIPACHSSIYNSNNLCQWLRNYCRRDLLYYVCPSISMLPVLQSRGGARSEAITQRLQSEVFILIRRKEQRSYHMLSECCLFIPLEQKKNSKNILIQLRFSHLDSCKAERQVTHCKWSGHLSKSHKAFYLKYYSSFIQYPSPLLQIVGFCTLFCFFNFTHPSKPTTPRLITS